MEKDTPQAESSEIVAELKAKLAELEAGWKRTAADFDNYRKRTESARALIVSYATGEIIRSLLPVVDNLRRAVDHAPADKSKEVKSWVAGLVAIEKQFVEILRQQGVEGLTV